MKKTDFKTVSVLVFVVITACGLICSGCDRDGDGDNETNGGPVVSSCIPCGGIDLSCPMCEITGCPVCFSLDEQTNGMIMVYDDGSYYRANQDGSEMTFYDSTGSQCFRMVITMEGDSTTTAYYSKNDELCYEMTTDADNTVTYDVDGKVYVYYPDDGSWDCPDGTTWTLPPFCENAEVEEADAPDTADTGMCPPVTRMCKPEELPDF